jgi:hypothetical protein
MIHGKTVSMHTDGHLLVQTLFNSSSSYIVSDGLSDKLCKALWKGRVKKLPWHISS